MGLCSRASRRFSPKIAGTSEVRLDTQIQVVTSAGGDSVPRHLIVVARTVVSIRKAEKFAPHEPIQVPQLGFEGRPDEDGPTNSGLTFSLASRRKSPWRRAAILHDDVTRWRTRPVRPIWEQGHPSGELRSNK